ncbi:phytoene desaturase family protein [Kushneria phosphatilytica]|uniref:Phytoene desaturase n=1 Tax=Kushneria phosphatilytica TaxID=657387 RepID=A0A1S1NZG8_9GAMM|nr:phytoene desaturase family protein [Kushneria phosphatilytica]OHV12273.1 phytoene dehydrogenase [Kushneria phosphatilytica]QEL11475.1 phytoene desaturase [Kushneria phosphatilytica]
MRTIVIGGGFGGMAAALRARRRGHEVTLIERCDQLGGRAQVFEDRGFRFDAGPTVITAPFLFEELFELFGCRLSDYVSLVALDTWYQFYFQDGRRFSYGADMAATLDNIRAFNPRDVEGYQRLLDTSREIFEIGFEQLADRPFHRFSTMAAQIPALLRLKSYRSVWGMVSAHIEDPALRQAFSIPPLLVGGNPFRTTSIYALIPWLERRWGVHFPMGGTGALVAALEKLMREQGITIATGTTVERVLSQGRRATGVSLTTGERLPADLVISNADAAHLYANMVDTVPASLRFKLGRARYSMGLFVLYLGTDRQFPDAEHHTIWMGPRFQELLEDIFERHHLAADFSLYVHRPTATDPSFAPPGGDSFYILAPVPNLQGRIDWQEEGDQLADSIIDALDRTTLPGLRESLVTRFHMTPEDFSHRYLSRFGAGFSIAPIFQQSAWFRFHNRSEALDNLLLVGAGTHPGAGVPGVLSSARVLEHLLPSV